MSVRNFYPSAKDMMRCILLTLCFGPVYSRRQCILWQGRSMYRYKGHALGCTTRVHNVHKLVGGTRAHEVHKGCWHSDGTTGTGAL